MTKLEKAFEGWDRPPERVKQLEALASDVNELLRWLGANSGSTEDWPCQIQIDSDEHMKAFLERMNKVVNDLEGLGFPQGQKALKA